ncbi:DUF89 family protein [Candidatus Bathyarchaeota archaeon]|nr:DUF89 family protein [Candidatus Bathyarchaeota archaeon]
MKIKLYCPSCLINRAFVESQKASDDPEIRLKSLLDSFKAISCNISPNVTPAYLGTIRDRTIKETSKNPDPFHEEKIISNQRAIELLPLAEDYVQKAEKPSDKFRKACLISIVGNAFEFGIKDYHFDYKDLPKWIEDVEKDIGIDHIDKIEKLANKVDNILFLTDNAGEIAFDKILVEQLKNMGASITVAVKAHPISNDATLDDAKIVNITKIADKVTTTGTDTVGLILEECSKEFLNEYDKADLVIAKGMAHYETITEYKLTKPHALLFRVKCLSISKDLKIDLGKNIAYLIEP